MSERAASSFPAGFDFESMLRIISKQIYETPLAFIRENVQNAVDAIRIQAHREAADAADSRFRIDVCLDGTTISVRDNGIGMTRQDLQNYFWTIGASGKRTSEALSAGCVGTFGIGGFANFGVCDMLEVTSQVALAEHGTRTRLSRQDIESAGTALPSISVDESDAAAPRGTLVSARLRQPGDVNQIREYLRDFVRYVPTGIFFNGEKLSQQKLSEIDDRENLTQLEGGITRWQDGDLSIAGRLFEDRKHALVVAIDAIELASESILCTGQVRFEHGTIDAFKRGFKLCATSIGTTIGVSGRLDCDKFVPTAGRDSLDAGTTSLLGRIVGCLERVAVDAVFESTERIAQHTRLFQYIVSRNMYSKLDKVRVNLADGSESTLGTVKRRAVDGKLSVFFGLAKKQSLNQIMHARGHIVVLLSSDHFRQAAERTYLQQFCGAKPFDGVVDCVEFYGDLSRFEKIVLSEMELNISKAYEIKNFELTPGKLTEDIPVFVKETLGSPRLEILVDTRHQEIAKLQDLGFTPILYSLVATFCREYLGATLKKWSPRFFGDGAINLELIAKRRSELWILLKDDIGVIRKGGQRQVVTSSDVQVVNVGQQPPEAKSRPRIVQIVDENSATSLAGYYIRLPDGAYNAYGDLLPECDSRGLVWAGNRIEYVISDAVSASFKYEVRLDEVVSVPTNGVKRAEGALALRQPLQALFDGLYFPIPPVLERYLVPLGEKEIRIELYCDWFDVRTAKHWEPRQALSD
jgi:molecular chaperone HtpG